MSAECLNFKHIFQSLIKLTYALRIGRKKEFNSLNPSGNGQYTTEQWDMVVEYLQKESDME